MSLITHLLFLPSKYLYHLNTGASIPCLILICPMLELGNVGGKVMLDFFMILILLASFGSLYLLVQWCSKQIDAID